MDFKQLLTKIDSLGGRQQLNEASKEDMEYYFGKDKKDSKPAGEKETGTGHMAKKTDKGTQYTKKDLPGQDTSKDADTKAAEKKAKKKANESIADLLRQLDALAEGRDEVEEEKTEEGNEFSGALAKAKAAGAKEFEVDGKKYQVKESEDDDSDEEDSEDEDDMNEAVDLEECYGQAMMSSQPEQESGMNINASTDTKTGHKSLTVTAQGEAAEQLAQLLKLSGVGAGNAAHDAEMEEAYANEPNPETQGVEVQLAQGNDLNRPKTMHPHSYRQGDNPMAMREAQELAAIEQRLNEELAAFKVMAEGKGKPDFLDMDKDGDRKEPMKKALADKSKKKEVSEAVVAEKAVSQQQQKFMGMVHAMQKGKKVKGASPELKKAAQSMSKKAARDYASTKHAGLPKKVSETEFKQQLRNLLEADGVKVSDAILEAGWRDFVNRGKKALGTAALAGTMALGAASADARVGADHDPNINRLTGKPMSSQQAEPAGTSQAAPNVAKFAPVERVNRTDSGIWIQHKGHEYKVHKEVSKDAPYPRSAQKASVTDAQLGFRGIGVHTVVLYPFDDELGYAPAILYSK